MSQKIHLWSNSFFKTSLRENGSHGTWDGKGSNAKICKLNERIIHTLIIMDVLSFNRKKIISLVEQNMLKIKGNLSEQCG